MSKIGKVVKNSIKNTPFFRPSVFTFENERHVDCQKCFRMRQWIEFFCDIFSETAISKSRFLSCLVLKVPRIPWSWRKYCQFVSRSICRWVRPLLDLWYCIFRGRGGEGRGLGGRVGVSGGASEARECCVGCWRHCAMSPEPCPPPVVGQRDYAGIDLFHIPVKNIWLCHLPAKLWMKLGN